MAYEIIPTKLGSISSPYIPWVVSLLSWPWDVDSLVVEPTPLKNLLVKIGSLSNFRGEHQNMFETFHLVFFVGWLEISIFVEQKNLRAPNIWNHHPPLDPKTMKKWNHEKMKVLNPPFFGL